MEQSKETIRNQWDKICAHIQKTEGSRFAVRWLSKIVPDRIEDNQVRLLVPSPCIHELVKQNYADRILSLWQAENADIAGLDLKLAQQAQRELPLASPAVLKPVRSSVLMPHIAVPADRHDEIELPKSLLNPANTFDSFVVGHSNEFACAAARRIAEEESVSFNPLYIHSGVGLGKTHLMHAIAWRMRELYPDKTVLYLSSEQFFHLFIKAMRTENRYERYGNTARFRDLFRSVDVLMIDDIQFICGKKATTTEFFHTFNTLIAEGKKIIISADSSPQDLQNIEARLQTRLAQGLVVNILPTSYELRLGILQEKMKSVSIPVPEDVLDFLARHVTSNVRELEGALKRVVAHADLMGEPINISTTRTVLKDLLHTPDKTVTLKEIQYAVCGHYQVSLTELKSTRRERRIARPRQLAMYLAKVLTPTSLPNIAQAFERDHTTVMHAIRTVENLLVRDKSLAADADMLMRRLKGESV